jgi:DNA polymerase III delta subunit
MSLWHVAGPNEAGPGEIQEMQRRVAAIFEQESVDDVTRVDVPGRGGGSGEASSAGFRSEVEAAVPALQSGSLFGGRQGLVLYDAQALLKAEVEGIAELLAEVPDHIVVVLVSAGSLPSDLAKIVKASGETVRVKKLREKDAAEWLAGELRARKLSLPTEARQALLKRFGSDVAAMAQALDQLAAQGKAITAELILDTFKNRPDEPMWHYADAVGSGDVGEALRRLSDFLTHGHPLQLLGFLESDLRRRALARAAPDTETLAEWLGVKPDDWRVGRDWKRRTRVSDSELSRALGALVRADALLKSAPVETHRLTMERLTVALCRLYGGRPARAV